MVETSFREDTPLYSDAAIRILHFSLAPHKLCIRAHWHERIEILRIQEGDMIVDIGADVYTVSAGEMVIVPPRIPHQGFAGERGVSYDVLIFDVRNFYNGAKICRQMLSLLYEGNVLLQNVSDHADVIRCVDALCHHVDQNSLASVAMVYQLLNVIMEHCILSIVAEKRVDIVRQITAYIEQNFTQDIDTAHLCQQFGYTAAHLCRKFKAVTGLTPMNYLKIYRLEQARKDIINSRDSISEIAAHCGYPDANYFTRCFTAHFGSPPSYYRKNNGVGG